MGWFIVSKLWDWSLLRTVGLSLYKDVYRFVNKRNFLRNNGVVKKKIVQRNVKKIDWFFTETNEFSKRFQNYDRFLLNEKLLIKRYFFTEQTIFSIKLLKKQTILFKRAIFLNKRFNWTVAKWENERKRRKITVNFDNERNTFFNDRKKRTNGSFSDEIKNRTLVCIV